MERCVDVIVPAYNASGFIVNTLQSIRMQGNYISRVIVVDDGSTDDTQMVVENYAILHSKSIKIICVRQNNFGPSAARNRGIALAEAKYVAFLDADDVWLKGKIEKQLRLFNSNSYPNLGLVYCDYDLISRDGTLLANNGFKLNPKIRGDVKHQLLKANLIAGSASAVLILNDALKTTGGFDESLVCAEDWDLWLRLSHTFAFDYVREPLVLLRQHENNAQKNELRMLGGELLFINKLYSEGNLRPYHLVRFWRRITLGGIKAPDLHGYTQCTSTIQLAVSGFHIFLFGLTIKAYYRMRGLVLRIFRNLSFR